MSKNIFVNKEFALANSGLRGPGITQRYDSGDYFIIEEDRFTDHSIYLIDFIQLFSIENYMPNEQMRLFNALNDIHLYVRNDFLCDYEEAAKSVVRLVKVHNFDPKKIWLQFCNNSEKSFVLNELEKNNIIGVNILAYNTYIDSVYDQYNRNIDYFQELHKSQKYPDKKRFSLFSRRYDQWRFEFASELVNRNLIDNFIYTFTNMSPESIPYPHEVITKDELKNFSKTLKHNNLEKLNEWIDNIPYVFNENNLTDSYALDLYYFYNKAHINVVLESRPIRCSNNGEIILLTEKTYKAVLMKKPFLLYSGNGALDLFKQNGFKSFSPLIQESYDTSDDESKPMILVDEIERLNKLSDTEFKKMLETFQEITEHNFNNFLATGEQNIKATEIRNALIG